MAHELDDTVLSQLYELLVEAGFDGLAEALTVLLNEVTLLERSQRSPMNATQSDAAMLTATSRSGCARASRN